MQGNSNAVPQFIVKATIRVDFNAFAISLV